MNEISSTSSVRSLRFAIHDLVAGLAMWRLWMAFGYEDLRQNYRRTLLGLTWIAISFGAFAFAYILIFSGLNQGHDARHFATWAVSGALAWQFISHVVLTGANVFIGSESWIKGVRLPLSVHIYKNLWRLAIQDGLSLVVAFVLIFAFGSFSLLGCLVSLLAIPLYLLLAVPVQFIFGLACVFSRDLQQFIGTFMRIAFFVTPIIWIPVPGTILQHVADINPFAYMIDLFRMPILEGTFPLAALGIWFILFVLMSALALIAYRWARPHLAYWL